MLKLTAHSSCYSIDKVCFGEDGYQNLPMGVACMETMSTVTGLKNSGDVLFLMLGAVMVFAMHAGFAFLEVGTVRKKNQVNAFVKIITDWSVSTIVYFVIGFPIAYGISFLKPVEELLGKTQGYDLVHFFFLLCFAACIPAII